MVLPYGNENACASFYKWAKSLFEHVNGYSVVYDKELTSPANRQELPFPCIVINQVDTTDPSKGFVGSTNDQNACLFYVYCMVNKSNPEFGNFRSVRRMKDQFVFALKKAGVYDDEKADVIVPPIVLFNFATNPISELDSTLTLNSSIMQHVTEDNEVIEYELMFGLNYLEKSNV